MGRKAGHGGSTNNKKGDDMALHDASKPDPIYILVQTKNGATVQFNMGTLVSFEAAVEKARDWMDKRPLIEHYADGATVFLDAKDIGSLMVVAESELQRRQMKAQLAARR